MDEDTEKIALGLKQLTEDPWSRVQETYEVGQVHTGRVTRVAEFGAFVELEPGVEGLAHASTFAPTGRSEGWSRAVAAWDDGRIRDPEHRSREETDRRRAPTGRLGARRHRTIATWNRAGRAAHRKGRASREVRCVRVPRSGTHRLIPLSETGVAKEADIARAFPVGADVEVVVLEADASGRRIRLSRKAVLDAREAEEVREYTERRETGCRPRGSDRLPISSAAHSSRGKSSERACRVLGSPSRGVPLEIGCGWQWRSRSSSASRHGRSSFCIRSSSSPHGCTSAPMR